MNAPPDFHLHPGAAQEITDIWELIARDCAESTTFADRVASFGNATKVRRCQKRTIASVLWPLLSESGHQYGLWSLCAARSSAPCKEPVRNAFLAFCIGLAGSIGLVPQARRYQGRQERRLRRWLTWSIPILRPPGRSCQHPLTNSSWRSRWSQCHS